MYNYLEDLYWHSELMVWNELRALGFLNNDSGRFLRDNIDRTDDVEIGDLWEDTGIDNAQPIHALDLEVRSQDGARVVGCSDRD